MGCCGQVWLRQIYTPCPMTASIAVWVRGARSLDPGFQAGAAGLARWKWAGIWAKWFRPGTKPKTADSKRFFGPFWSFIRDRTRTSFVVFKE